VRWEALFEDLELQWESAEAAELGLEVADRSRREAAYLRLVDRVRPAVGYPLRLGVIGDAPIAGQLTTVGVDWLLLAENAVREVLLPTRSVLWIHGLSAVSAQPGHEGPLAAKLDLRYALRGIVRDRSACSIVLIDGSSVTGTVDRVGVDFIEIAEHPEAEFRRPRTVLSARTIPLSAVALVRRTA
jgi:hypothetical protein